VLAEARQGLRSRSRFPGAAAVIGHLAKEYKSGEILIGAGTVLDPETARIAILADAQYILSPSVSVEAARLCNRTLGSFC
jgi:2-dehydro-3-deoxyphosphogluconate aldolase/(4S)-4-hydroxy-2-oxoglutarate aldolase